MSVLLDTGDNPTHRTKILKKATRYLEQHHNCKTLFACSDKTRTRFSYKIQDPNGNKFYLVARSTPAYKGLVSIQDWLIKRADREKNMIIMYMDNQFLLLDPKQILKQSIGTNERYGELMNNFPASLGLPMRFWSVELNQP